MYQLDLTENKQYLCKKTYNTKLKKKINKYLFTSLFLISLTNLFSQESTRIQIDSAGFFEKDDIKFSDATVLTRDNKNKVKISHEGVDLWCNQAYFYGPTDIISEGSNIYCELGFYDTNSYNVYFIKEYRV